MLVNLPKVTQLARRRPGVYKGHAFVCYVLSWFPSQVSQNTVCYARSQGFLEVLKCILRVCENAFSLQSTFTLLEFQRLWPGEWCSLAGSCLFALSRCGWEFQEQVLSLSSRALQRTRAPWLTIAVPLPRMCWRGMAVASKQAGRRHASCQVENIKDNNNYSRKKNLHWLQKAKSRGLGALLITLKEAQTKHHCKSPLPRLFPGPMEKMRFKGQSYIEHYILKATLLFKKNLLLFSKAPPLRYY